jgi:hypothetical protein
MGLPIPELGRDVALLSLCLEESIPLICTNSKRKIITLALSLKRAKTLIAEGMKPTWK